MRFQKFVNNIEQPSQEMFDFYEKRTKEHIARVQNNISKIIKKFPEISSDELMKRSANHDKSKYSKKEYIPYVWLTWWHKQRREGKKWDYPNDQIKNSIKRAWKHHSKVNYHHPEAHRDPTKMSDVDIAEMVADWASMSQEYNEKLMNWVNKVVNKKWKFTKDQTDLIYKIAGIF